MLKRTILATAAAALTLAAPALGATARSTVTIDEYSTGGSPDYFIGRVTSPRPKCEVGRRVTLYRKGADELTKVGSDRSARSKGDTSIWVVEADVVSAGTFVAKVKRQQKGATICKGDRSPNFVLN